MERVPLFVEIVQDDFHPLLLAGVAVPGDVGLDFAGLGLRLPLAPA